MVSTRQQLPLAHAAVSNMCSVICTSNAGLQQGCRHFIMQRHLGAPGLAQIRPCHPTGERLARLQIGVQASPCVMSAQTMLLLYKSISCTEQTAEAHSCVMLRSRLPLPHRHSNAAKNELDSIVYMIGGFGKLDERRTETTTALSSRSF